MHHRSGAALGAVAVLCHLAAAPAASAAASELTLEAALDAARSGSPEIRRAEAAVEEARGRLVRARTYPHNPRIEAEGAERSGADGSTTDRGIAVAQELEIAGQRGKRVAVSREALKAAAERLERTRRRVLATVERTFAEAVRARDLLEVARADVELTRNLLSFEERRLEAGAGTRIDVNLARAAAGRAVRRFQEAKASWLESRARLAEAAGLDPSAPPRPTGELPGAPSSLPPLEELTRRALAERADLAALRRERSRSERRVTLERSLASPNLEVGAFSKREEGAEVHGLRAGIALPVFDRNQGGIAEAEASVGRAAAELATAELAARREVSAAYGHYEAAAEAVTALEGLVLESLTESLGLLRRAVESGELSATDVLLLRRELVEGQRERIRAAGELWIARTDLELAVGSDLALPEGADRADREETDDED